MTIYATTNIKYNVITVILIIEAVSTIIGKIIMEKIIILTEIIKATTTEMA